MLNVVEAIPKRTILSEDSTNEFMRKIASSPIDVSALNPEEDWLAIAYIASLGARRDAISHILSMVKSNNAPTSQLSSYYNSSIVRGSWPCREAETRFFEDKKSNKLRKIGPMLVKNTGLTLGLCTETTEFENWTALMGVMYLPRDPGNFNYTGNFDPMYLNNALWQPTRIFNIASSFRYLGSLPLREVLGRHIKDLSTVASSTG